MNKTEQPTISQATDDDLIKIAAIESISQQTPWSKQMLNDSLLGDHLCWKISLNNELWGYLIAMRVMEQLEILNVVVSPQKQKQGFATLLLKHLEVFSKSEKIDSVFLEVRKSNQKAINLYQKHGFELIGVRQNYYACREGREDALIMQLSY